MNICRQNKDDALKLHRYIIETFGGERIQIAPKLLPCSFPYGNAYAVSPEGYCDFCSSLSRNERTKFTDIDITDKKKLVFRPECRKCKCLPLCLGGCAVRTEQNTECCIPEKYQMQEIIAHYIARLQSA